MAITNNQAAISPLTKAKKAKRNVKFSGVPTIETNESPKNQDFKSRCMVDLTKCETFNTISAAMLNRNSFQATLMAWRRREQALANRMASMAPINSTQVNTNENNVPRSLESSSICDATFNESRSSNITVEENGNFFLEVVEPDRARTDPTAPKCKIFKSIPISVVKPDKTACPAPSNVRPLGLPPQTTNITNHGCMPGDAQGASLSSTVINVASKNITKNAFEYSEKQLSPLTAPCSLDCAGNKNDKKMKAKASSDKSGPATIVLECLPHSHPFKRRTILLQPDIECKVGRNVGKRKASESNAIFDCKVLSLDHAVLWYSKEGKFWIRDTKSSNGTFINDQKLGTEAAELHFGDIIKFGAAVLKKSLKRVHVGIIGSLCLYLPDGREAKAHCSPLMKDDVISYKDLDCLSINMQESTQHGKPLKSKIFIINNLLDAPSKSSTMMLPSMQGEDQQMHNIHSLERNLQLVDKGAPENTLSKEILQLLDDEDKEALLKVCQDRCDAVHPLSKEDSLHGKPDDECEFLLDQMIASMQCMQEVTDRLTRIEAEYNQYKEDAQRQLIRAKELSEEREALFLERLQRSDMACEALWEKLGALRAEPSSVAESDDGQFEQIEKQALEYLDAVIGDVESADDEEEANGHKATQSKSVQNTTIVKWLRNLELSKNGSPLTIDSAICNRSYSCDERDSVLSVGESVCRSSCDFSMKLTKVPRILQHLERDMSSTLKALKKKSATGESNIENLNDLNYKNFLLLSHCVAVVQEAYDDFCFRTKQKALDQKKSISSIIPNASSDVKVDSIDMESDESNESKDASGVSSRLTIETVLSAFGSNRKIEPAHKESERVEKGYDGQSELSKELLRSKNQLQIMCERIRNQQEANGKKLFELNVTIGNLRTANQELVQVVNENISHDSDAEDANGEGESVIEPEMQTEIASSISNPTDLKAEMRKAIPEQTDEAIEENLNKCEVFERKIPGDQAKLGDFVLNRENKVIVYKECLKNADNGNVQLWQQFAELDNQIPYKLSWMFVRLVLPCGAVLVCMLMLFIVLVKC